MTKSTNKTSEESSKKRVDNLLLQGFQKLAKITPMAPDLGLGPKVSHTIVTQSSPHPEDQ